MGELKLWLFVLRFKFEVRDGSVYLKKIVIRHKFFVQLESGGIDLGPICSVLSLVLQQLCMFWFRNTMEIRVQLTMCILHLFRSLNKIIRASFLRIHHFWITDHIRVFNTVLSKRWFTSQLCIYIFILLIWWIFLPTHEFFNSQPMLIQQNSLFLILLIYQFLIELGIPFLTIIPRLHIYSNTHRWHLTHSHRCHSTSATKTFFLVKAWISFVFEIAFVDYFSVASCTFGDLMMDELLDYLVFTHVLLTFIMQLLRLLHH